MPYEDAEKKLAIVRALIQCGKAANKRLDKLIEQNPKDEAKHLRISNKIDRLFSLAQELNHEAIEIIIEETDLRQLDNTIKMAETGLKRVEDTRKFLRVLSGLVAFAGLHAKEFVNQSRLRLSF